MTPAPKNPGLARALSDPARLEVLMRTGLLDSSPEEAFDRLTRLAGEILDAPVILVSLVDDHRQFFKSQVGLPEPWATQRETPLSHSFCQHVVASAKPLVVNDAREHPLLRDNLAVRDLQVIAYLGVPLTTPEGKTLGSLCTIESRPRTWTAREIKIMEALAEAVIAEVELRLLARHFHSNCLELRQTQIEREELVQMLVHDLRNPLSSLILGLDLVRASPDPTQQQERLKTIHRGAAMLLKMVNDILDVSKADAGRLDLNFEEICAGEVIDTACDLVAEIAREAKISLHIGVDGDVPRFRADKEKLRRVLVNLISNAAQHTPPYGKITVSVSHDIEKKRIVFEVADTGVGIPKEAFSRVFEKFQPRIRTSVPKTSTGLGLSFCKKATEAHGGGISIQSELGKGTTFRVEIPQEPTDPSAEIAPKAD